MPVKRRLDESEKHPREESVLDGVAAIVVDVMCVLALLVVLWAIAVEVGTAVLELVWVATIVLVGTVVVIVVDVTFESVYTSINQIPPQIWVLSPPQGVPHEELLVLRAESSVFPQKHCSQINLIRSR